MATRTTPGVYIDEISTLPASIAGVATAIPAFIGHTQKKTRDGVSLVNQPVRITSMLEFVEIFGGAKSEDTKITVTITDTRVPAAGAVTERKVTAVIRKKAAPATGQDVSNYKLFYQLQMYFNNGGGPCYIICVEDYSVAVAKGTLEPKVGLLGGLQASAAVDEITIYVFPDFMLKADQPDVYNQALTKCKELQDRFVIMDVRKNTAASTIVQDSNEFRDTTIGTSYLKYGASYYPELKTTLNFGYDESLLTVTHALTNPAANGALNGNTLTAIKASNPDVYRLIKAELNKLTVDLLPSGAVAGIYARVDRDRGVWKAPANVDIRSISEPLIKISTEDQQTLNVDPTSGKSINAIRTFKGKGTLVWGARTLAGNDNEWRYIPVRRFYNFAEESIKKATEFVVFEPNDANTWLRAKTMIENFLTKLWRDGALAGAKPEDAFEVRVGLGITMTSLDILEGRMNIEIGLAVVRPAEFIILKFSHLLQKS